MTRFRPASPGDVDAILAMMRGYYEQDGYTFVEAEARSAARRSRSPRPTAATPA